MITQWWDSENSVTQLTASVFVTRDAPQLAINSFIIPVTTKSQTFEASYYQAQGDAINSVRWMVAEAADESNPLLDTGDIEGTGILRVAYDGFFTGIRYAVRCIVTTQYNIVD